MQRHHFRRLRIAVTILFVVCAVVVMVGPTKAVSGLVTHTLDFLLAAAEAPGSIDTKAHVAFSQTPSATEQQLFAPDQLLQHASIGLIHEYRANSSEKHLRSLALDEAL